MKGVQELRQELVSYLKQKGLDAVPAWREEKRQRLGKATAAVSLRGMECKGSGLQNYLGERFDREKGQWEELYGRTVELTFGLDMYAGTAEEVQRGLDVLTAALDREGPGGMKVKELSVGETVYREGTRGYVCPVQGRFEVWAVAVDREDGSFLDFEVRGENRE